ncbi:MAG: nucleoside hydrolase, partial [Lachnospiraceae bacterium]|nr:nucleoside hydrolase [Lachnospiraceae bacterium]
MNRKKVIIDCDPGIDDSLAIMLALASPELEVLGITVTAGNAPVDMGAGNAGKVLDFCHRSDIPVYAGAGQPLVKEYINALDTHGADGLGESFLDVPKDFYVQEKPAVEFLAETLGKGGVSVIALGPLTNLAELIKKDSQAFGKIERLVSMGGNFRSHGNCSPVAEYNYWEDPDAAALVFRTLAEQNGRIEMVGLDVTRK